MKLAYIRIPVARERQNRVREDRNEEATSKKSRKKGSTVDGEGRFARFKAFWSDERVHKVGGLFLILFSAYLLVAFTSFLFTWPCKEE